MNMLFTNGVNDFLQKCSVLVGDYYKVDFMTERTAAIKILEITSPIEQLLFIALETLIKTNDLSIEITPQYVIDKYRVDFLLSFIPDTSESILIIECDSQEWHERTEKERRYEKQRDRYLTSKGYKFLHFTGKEIKQDPIDIAYEILRTFTNLNIRKA